MARAKKTAPRSLKATQGTRLRLGSQGRLVLPLALRRALGLKAGQELSAAVESGALVLRPPNRALEELKALWREVQPKRPGELLSEELIRERREEAAREAAE